MKATAERPRTPGPALGPDSPPVRRHQRPTWRDPRLVLGVVVVAASMLLGARLLAGADDTVAVWAAARALSAGEVLGPEDVVRREVRFVAAEDADRYVPASSAPAGMTVLREVGEGELVPRRALGTHPARPLLQVPIAAPVTAVPATVGAGSVVDVWVTSEPGADGPARARIAFDDVTVVAAPRPGGGFGPSTTRQIIVAVDPADRARIATGLARLASGRATVVSQGRG